MVPTCYGRQAIRYEFEGLMMCSTSALIDSNRAAECKALLFVLFSQGLDACISHKSGAFQHVNPVNRLTVDSVIWSSRTSN